MPRGPIKVRNAPLTQRDPKRTNIEPWMMGGKPAGITSLVMTNQSIKAGVIQGEPVGETVMQVKGELVVHVTVHDGVTLEGPTLVTLDSLSVPANVPAGTVVANIDAVGGTPPYTFNELVPLSAELAVVGAEVQTTQPLTDGETHDITIGVTDANGLSFNITPAFEISVGIDVPPVGASFVTGWIPGNRTTTSLDFTIRLDGAATVELFASVNSDMSGATAVGAPVVSALEDYESSTTRQMAKVSVEGLTPDTSYYFRVSNGTITDPRTPRLRTKQTNNDPFRVLISSCSDESATTPNSPIYLIIRDDQTADEVVHEGDKHYADLGNLTNCQRIHRSRLADWSELPNVDAMLLGNTTLGGGSLGDHGKALIELDDDHDFFNGNNGNMGTPNYDVGAPLMIEATNSMIPQYPYLQPTTTGTPPEPYTRGRARTIQWPGVRFHFLDCRTFKSINNTMIGDGATYDGLVTWDALTALEADIDAAVAAGDTLFVVFSSATWERAEHDAWGDTASVQRTAVADMLTSKDIFVLMVFGDQHSLTASHGAFANYTTGALGVLPALGVGPLNHNDTFAPNPALQAEWAGVALESSTENQVYLQLDINPATGNYTAEFIDILGAVIPAMGTITNTDITNEIQFPSATGNVDEDAGTVDLTIERTFIGACSVSFATTDGTAEAGTDYTDTSGTIDFLPHERARIVSVPIIDRPGFEQGDLDFTMTLSSAVNADLGSVFVSTVTIIDQDGLLPAIPPADLTGVVAAHDSSIEVSITHDGAGLVERWADQINSNDWVITSEAFKPETDNASKNLNGKNTIFFDGDNAMQDLTTNLGDTNWTVWMGRFETQLSDAGSSINIFISTGDGGGDCQACTGPRNPLTSDKLMFFGGGAVIEGTTDLNDGDLICLVTNFDKGVRAEVFLNGVSEILTTTAADVGADTDRLVLGGNTTNPDRGAVGSVVETAFGTGTMPQSEIDGLYQHFLNEWVP